MPGQFGWRIALSWMPYGHGESSMKFGRLAVVLCLALSAVIIAQQALANESIERMARARLGDDVIVSFMQNLGPLVAVLCLALSAVLVTREALTNKSIEKMAHARSGDDVTVSSIQDRVGQSDVMPVTLIDFRKK
jgi:hypothetical protein